MRVTLNLATRPFADLGPALKRLRIAMAVLARRVCFARWACIFLTARPRRPARASTRSMDASPAFALNAKADEAMMHQPANAQLLNQAAALNQLFDEKAFSWTLAMEAMETVLPAGVQVRASSRSAPKTATSPASARGGPARSRRRSGEQSRALEAISSAAHRGRKRRVGQRPQSAAGTCERIQSLRLRSAGRIQSADAGRARWPQEARESVPSHSSPGSANLPRSHLAPAFPTQHGRPPYTGPSQPAANPAQRTPGGPQ